MIKFLMLSVLFFSCNAFASFASKTCVLGKESVMVEVVLKVNAVKPAINTYIAQQTRQVNGKGVRSYLFFSRSEDKAGAQAQKKVDELTKKKYVCS
jgi:hypothetical protein